MEIWYYWALAALLLFIIEMFTTGFAVICISIGAAGAAIGAALDTSLEMQFIIFAAVSLLALLGVRPLLKRLFYNKGEKVITNADAIIGKRGIVCLDIEPNDNNGRVMIDGIDWRAISADNEPIAKGTKVEVVARESIILTVKKL